MESNNQVFEQRSFNEQQITCARCGWRGSGTQTHVAEFYGIGNFKEVLCPKCDSHIGNLSRERSAGQGRRGDPGGGPT